MTTERAFDEFIATIPVEFRDQIMHSAWGNSWADGARNEYESDEEAWAVAINTAKMMADDPAGWGFEPEG